MNQHGSLINLSSLQFNECCAPIVESLSEPLFKNFGITHFGYTRMLENGQLLRIATNQLWTRKYFENEFYNDSYIYNMDDVPLNGSRYVPLIGIPKNKLCMTMCLEFNIWNFMLIYERFSNYGDLWFFATTKDNTQIMNFYLNNKSVLKHFTLYFKDKAADLFKTDESSKLISTKILPLKEEFKESKLIEKFTKEITYHKYYLNGKYNGRSLSKRESECLFFFSQGRTLKEIGEKTQISPRTVEVYINNIKNKLGCHTRGELSSVLSGVKTPF